MQGNAFLGAFFSVSPMLTEFGITPEQFRDAVHKQYVKKFGKLGDAVVVSNMEVMTKGFELVREIKVGEMEAADRSTLRGKALLPIVMPESIAAHEGCSTGCRTIAPPADQPARPPLTRVADFDAMFRAKLGYNQPANAYSALGIMAAGSGDTASKYVAGFETTSGYLPSMVSPTAVIVTVASGGGVTVGAGSDAVTGGDAEVELCELSDAAVATGAGSSDPSDRTMSTTPAISAATTTAPSTRRRQ